MIKIKRILEKTKDNRLAVIGAIDYEDGYLVGIIDGTKFTSATSIEQCSLECEFLKIEYNNINGVRKTDMYRLELMTDDEYYKSCTTIITGDKVQFYKRKVAYNHSSAFVCRELAQSKYEVDTLLEEDEVEARKPLMYETYSIAEDKGDEAWFDKTEEFVSQTGITVFDKVEVLLKKVQYAYETDFENFDGEIRLYTCGKRIEISSSEWLNFVIK